MIKTRKLWVSPEGKVHNVDWNNEHSDYGLDNFLDEETLDPDLDKDDIVPMLVDKGYVRGSIIENALNLEGPINKDIVKSIATKYGLPDDTLLISEPYTLTNPTNIGRYLKQQGLISTIKGLSK